MGETVKLSTDQVDQGPSRDRQFGERLGTMLLDGRRQQFIIEREEPLVAAQEAAVDVGEPQVVSDRAWNAEAEVKPEV